MLRFAETDNKLVSVISHEIAHNLMRHVCAVLTNYALGTAVDLATASIGIITANAIGAAAVYAKAPAFEAEADYVALYIMAKAGLPIDQAAQFWCRIAAIQPGSIHHRILATHPSSPKRAIARENTIEEIKQKRALGAELVPELRPRSR